MPPKPPSLYNLKKTTIWFSIASIFLLVGLVLMVLQDSTREWKHWQSEFIEYQREKAEEELTAFQKTQDKKQLEDLRTKLKSAREQMDLSQNEMESIEAEIGKRELELIKIRMTYQTLTQEQDSDRYFFEENRVHKHTKETKKYEERLAKRAPEIAERKLQIEKVETEIQQFQNELRKFSEQLGAVNRDLKSFLADQVILEKKIKKLTPGWMQGVLNAPMLDFIAPSLQIQQIVLENLYDDYYFTKTQKVDRCITCHLGIDQKGFENASVPFKTHPKLDLFLSPDSPHPMEEFGCTTCHGGGGHSVSFYTAAHTPQNEEQAKEWEKKYHWHPMKHWADKMLPLQHMEASCVKCHSGVVDVPMAPKLNAGRRLAKTFGCTGCHEAKSLGELWKVGPSLTHVQSKLEQDWIVRWLHNPKEFRPSTKMPRVFHLSNTSDPESKENNNTVIAGIAAYLLKNSESVSLEAPKGKGDPAVGETLIKTLGCLGCHSTDNLKANDHGPELSGLGSKVKADWLYTWIRNPFHYSKTTRMPNLRLTDEEAADITSYLLTGRNEKFESTAIPPVNPEKVDEMGLTFLAGKMRTEEAKAELERMNPSERLEFIGKQTIAHQGCFGCHDIKGFEAAKAIGTSLNEEGSKDVKKLDFGFAKIGKTREAWFFQKLKEPRIFDQGKEKKYHDKLKMPQFDFSDAEAGAMTTFLLSLQKAQIPLEMKKQLSSREQEIEAGRRIVEKFNCQGCHTLDGIEGRVRAIIEDPGAFPPGLDGEGKKVQPEWLYQFLHRPEVIRPWITYRMPTFGFDEEQLNTVVNYFNHLSQMAPAYHSMPVPDSASEEVSVGRELFKSFQCIKCHQSKPDSSLSASFLAPDLVIAKDRLRPEWVAEWMKDPQTLQPGTMMPAFFPDGQSPVQTVLDGDYLKQIQAIRNYLWVFTPEEASLVTQKK